MTMLEVIGHTQKFSSYLPWWGYLYTLMKL